MGICSSLTAKEGITTTQPWHSSLATPSPLPTLVAHGPSLDPTPMPRTPRSSSGASVRLSQRLMPTMAMEDMADTVLATPLAMVLATVMAAMARGLLTLRPTPTTATLDMVDTDSVMAGTATAVSATAMARGLLMLMPSTAMEDMVLAFMESLPHA